MTNKDEAILIGAASLAALFLGAFAFAWWATYTPKRLIQPEGCICGVGRCGVEEAEPCEIDCGCTPGPSFASAEDRLMLRRVHVGGLVVEVRHMIAIVLGVISWLFCPLLTSLVAYKKFRHLWAVEGVLLGLLPCYIGLLVEWLALPDLSAGRERPLSGILSGR